MPKDTRDKVTLSPDAYKVLEVEAMLMGISLKDAASKLIIKAACPKCKEILDIMARPPKDTKEERPKGPITQEPKSQTTYAQIMDERRDPQMLKFVVVEETKDERTQEPKDQKAQVPYSPKAKRPRLSKNPEAIAKIKELWNSTPRPSINEIAKTIDYPKATVAENIKKIKDKGDLAN
ncbi:MAG: hypothetical protein E4G89_06170 [Methanothrix sp.]|nr:MAG: hypothetical protein E4G89_06170 [Methanothrix sp.]